MVREGCWHVDDRSRPCENSEIVLKRRIWSEFFRSAEPVMAENAENRLKFINCRPGVRVFTRSGPEAAIRLSYSITSSARARIDGGTVRPSALAVLRLTTSSNVVGCCTGKSAGLAPLRILPA